MNTLFLSRPTQPPIAKPLLMILVLIMAVPALLHAQKESLSFQDLRYWRTHAVSLSDNGAWYTKLYSLSDQSKAEKDSLTEQAFQAFYQEENQTDILYICSTTEGVKYQIKDGSKPTFSANSDWIAYQIKPEAEKEAKGKKDKQKTFIELRHLSSDFTVRYESGASYRFLEERNYFLTADKNSLLIYDLDKRKEHYIGDLGEYLIDKQSPYIAYTIASEDKRGNGIYLYDPETMTTRALQTGPFTYGKLAWNHEKNALAAYQYAQEKDKPDYAKASILVVNGIDTNDPASTTYPSEELEGLPENMVLAVKSNAISWSKEGNRLFVSIKKHDPENQQKEKKAAKADSSTVQIWHWKDKKLLSERIMEYERKKDESYEAILFRDSKKLMPVTGEALQKLIRSKGTDSWAIGTDNRKYISDWDIERNDLYRIDLRTGDKQLIREGHAGYWFNPNVEISPNGEKAILWDGEHYAYYDFATASLKPLSSALAVSFVDEEFDRFGPSPNYGFVGWVKEQEAVLVNHKHDIWLLDLADPSLSRKLTAKGASEDAIRFRWDDFRFASETEIEDRYLDLAKPHFLYAFNTQTKYAGFYQLHKGKLKELIYKPASFYGSWRGYNILKSKTSETIIYEMGDYEHAPEAYLSRLDFSKPQQLTHTNPQQEKFKWGKRILIDYTNDDGVPLQGVLSIPEGYKKGQKLPMMVYSYEKYSWRMYRYASPYLSGASLPEMLYVSDGYLFLQPDIHFNVGTPHSDMHECIDAAIEKVIELGYVDEDKIGYEGFSFGGHCGMYMSTQENRFAAIAAGAGVSNLVQGFNIDIVRDGSNEQDYYMTGQGRLGTDPTSNIDMYVSESPVFNAQTMNTPLLLFHGTTDKVVQWEHSFGFYSILRYLKKPVVFLSYLDEGHGLRKEANRIDIQRRLKAYFDHYLKDGEAEKWMLEELPYIPEEAPKKKDQKSLPKWK
ncbi:MAG: prolyl oligopeptidase family serine peptidase [Bacteroidota bacterium]